MSYIVYVKSMIPTILLLFWTEDELPSYLGNDWLGRFVWGTFFTFIVLLPLSIPREINQLRWSSIFGVFCSIYLGLAIMGVYFCNREVVPTPYKNFQDAEAVTS